MDVLDNGSVLRLRNHDGNPAQLRSSFVSVPGATPEFGRKRRSSSGDDEESSPPGPAIKRVWSIAKRVKREISSDFCLHGRIVEALLRSQGEEGATYRIEARVDTWGGSKGVPEREQLKSGNVRPWRFMYFEKGEWVEFCEEANSVAWERYRSGNLTAEIRVQNRVYLLNFSDMTQTNLSTNYVRSIAWIGDAWQVSLPANPIASPSERSPPGPRVIRHRTTWRDGATDSISNLFLGPDGTGDAPDDHPDAKGDDELTKLTLGGYVGVTTCLSEAKKPAVVAALEEKSPPASSFGQRFVKLELETPEADDVKRKFLSGFGNYGDGSIITAIHRDASSVAAVRSEAFERQRALTEQARGYSNVRFAWHGTSKKGVTGIFLHGFGQPRTPKNGCVYGVGVYLAVENQSFVSALYADNDENGVQHVVLCKVIAGASELVKPPSEQFHPSSEHFDTGVDDLHAPKRLIVWSTHMNTHILPLYVVSFKLPSRWHDMLTSLNNKHRGLSAFCHNPQLRHPHYAQQTSDVAEGLRKPTKQQGPTSPYIRFPSLVDFLQQFLSPEQRRCLKEMHSMYDEGVLTRKGFVNEIMKMVGKHCLLQAINNSQDIQECHGASVFKAL